MFSVGEEVVVVDDSDDWIVCAGKRTMIPVGLKKGDVFTVRGVIAPRTKFGTQTTTTFCIQIGLPAPAMEALARQGELLDTLDVWPADRFRKVERKRTREELYALIGIDLSQNGTVRVLETVDA